MSETYRMDVVEELGKSVKKEETKYDCYKQCWKSFSLTESKSMYNCFQECNRKKPGFAGVRSPRPPIPAPPPYILQNGKRWFSPEPLSKDK